MNITGIDNNHPFGFSPEQVMKRQLTIEKVKQTYGFNKSINLKFYTQLLDTKGLSSLMKEISEAIKEIQPDTLYIPNRSDVHSDHKIAFQAIYSCTKQFRYPLIKRKIKKKTLSETEFAPALVENVFITNTFVDITEKKKKKIEITV